MTLPVLIGSRALYEYGIVDKFNDIDLLVNYEQAGLLSFKCDKKENKMIWFGKLKVDLHLCDCESNKLIFDECNKVMNNENLLGIDTLDPPFLCKKINLLQIGDVYVPPIDVLYVIIKSHIHRILPLTPYQNQNIEIWMKHLIFYKRIRDHIGYQYLDNTLYNDYLGGWKNLHNDGSYVDFINKIYQTRFMETIKNFGDTNISMDKSESEFFNDNVPRYVDHDKLHSKLGMILRNDPSPIFKKYQKSNDNSDTNSNNAIELDKLTFIDAKNEDRLAMLREEIMVLLLERKWIPEIINCNNNNKVTDINHQMDIKKYEIIDIAANFITNLCGQGDYWLRRYCLDHAHLLLDPKMYPFDKLIELAFDITGYQDKIKNMDEKKTKIDIDSYNNENFPFIKFLWNWIDKHRVFIKTNKNIKTIYFHRDEKFEELYFMDISGCNIYLNPDDDNDDDNVDDDYNHFNRLILGKDLNCVFHPFLSYLKNPFNIGIVEENKNYTIYNLVKNVGIHYNEKESFIFKLKIDSTDEEEIRIEGIYMYATIGGKLSQGRIIEFDDNYEKSNVVVYYYSKRCEFKEKKDRNKVSYVSSYGSSPYFLQPLLEIFAKLYLRVDDSDYKEYKKRGYNEYHYYSSDPENDF